MAFRFFGKHLIAGEWVSGETTFGTSPAYGPSRRFAVGTPTHVDAAAKAAEDAFWTYGYTDRAERAAFLDAIADEIEKRTDAITEIGCQETGLSEGRFAVERDRTTDQLRLFASHVRKGDYLDRRRDIALPGRRPSPRPDMRLMQRPVGPVAVFGASNFPLAFSTAGGDTASALAAGCPVVFKCPTAHPGTGEVVARAIDAAIKASRVHPGTFAFIQGGKRDVGIALVRHPLIKAAGFTGSLGGGRALFDLCAARPEPIPFFGELGSVNPMFLFANALAARGDEIARGWVESLTQGAGQFCTNPGIAVVLDGPDADTFIAAVGKGLAGVGAQTMLTDDIARAFRSGVDRIRGAKGVRDVLTTMCDRRDAAPCLCVVTAKAWLSNEALGEEVFGPMGLVVKAAGVGEMLAIARSLRGQLTCTLHLNDADLDEAHALLPVLERKAGRLLINSFPTGVEVCDAMVHGGPFPASTNFGATSVGTMAIRRFLRPVCYQDMPDALLPRDLVAPAWRCRPRNGTNAPSGQRAHSEQNIQGGPIDEQS